MMPPKPPKPPIRIIANASNSPPTRIARPPPFQAKPAPSRTVPRSHSPPHPNAEATQPWIRAPTFRSARDFAIAMTVGLSALVWLRDHYIDYTYVRGSSMAPTLNALYHETGAKDLVVMQPGARNIARGDVVLFWKPRNARELGIKRVVGVEGDEVWPRSGYAVDKAGGERMKGVLDGLHDIDGDSVASERAEAGRVVVPYGHVWVEGDNSRNSLDSRENGPISKGLVVGKAVWVLRGWRGFSRIGDERGEKERKLGSRIVEGRAEIPEVFLE
ncbi:peptidase S24/S26A/S26B/S26C [Phaeosphaeria sp. MPI-PUGE-AT-0046c]|nr:peptidase S24/S26A/S26B/S26C [Phaeosphaeria sp. MPI-PUGE-AT-0046c]